MSTAEQREAALAYFRAELGRDPTWDEELLLRAIGALPASLGPTHIPSNPLEFIVTILKRAQAEGRTR